jgi:hypothetical protein
MKTIHEQEEMITYDFSNLKLQNNQSDNCCNCDYSESSGCDSCDYCDRGRW